MMIKSLKISILIFIFVFISNFPSFKSQKSLHCDRNCPGAGGALSRVPYPFGFSAGCGIRLNCSENGTVSISEFAVQEIHHDALLVGLPAKCGRDVGAFRRLYGGGYAPTSNNAILMQNCTGGGGRVHTCMIPATMVQTHLEMLDCGGGNRSEVYGNVSCYSGDKRRMFLDYGNLTRTGCRFLLSGIVSQMIGDSSAVSLDVQVVKLGWWLKGRCRCSDGANCTRIVSPVDGGAGYRCQCRDGFVGDGYKASSGCRKGSFGCNPSKYLTGRCEGKSRIGILIGAVTIGASSIVCVCLVYCYLRRRTISKSRHKRNRRFCGVKGITIPIYPFKEIEKATNDFSDKQKLGTGAYGTVYSGKLRNGEWVAIKRIKHRYDTDNIEQVMNEINLLSSVSHPNLVRLLGCSVDKDDQILVERNGLPWPVRLTIVIETAQAISYLHSAMNPPIYHRDIKSSNILLDYNFKTKVADFGLSRLGIIESSHISTAPQGTPGYLDPQYHQNFHLSDKSDVYSFGVVLVEIITSLKAVDFSRERNDINLASLAVDRIGRGCLDEIIDPFLQRNKDISMFDSIHKVAEVAFRCLAYDSDMRPPMTEVLVELKQIRALCVMAGKD
ncbi:hypothetical protein OSB04_005165 [Centaurea solstitialis]|uniref:Protein kinase domain-containing protein n=1 Tax=Centaurea solstitialis TaxID=347529 RepID=A0AA38TS45_9ASTR|nr:hypothetical protein OSB04_005165 [Centaurea solstitialis]